MKHVSGNKLILILILLFYLGFIIRAFESMAKKEERFFSEQEKVRNSLKYFADVDSIYIFVEPGAKDYEELLVKLPLIIYNKPLIITLGRPFAGMQTFYYLHSPNQIESTSRNYSILDSVRLDNCLIYIKKSTK